MPTARSILIITQEFDPHADALIVLLRELGHDPIRVHTADFPLENSLTMRYGPGGIAGMLTIRGHRIDLDALRAIWWRRPAPFRLPSGLTDDERSFAEDELEQALKGLWVSLEACYWVSSPHSIRLASYKPGQLQRAAELGFAIPRTLITNDADQVRAFYDACDGQIVYKVLSDPMLQRATVIDAQPSQPPLHLQTVHTTPVKPAHLSMLEHQVRLAPCQFQETVPKSLELRVTLIDDELFTAEIHSQLNAQTRYDWRYHDVPVEMRRGSLPADIADQCVALTKGYGLNFGAIDLILTPDGRYVFLEINPNGQWLFVQMRVPELRMKEALAAALMRGNKPVQLGTTLPNRST